MAAYLDHAATTPMHEAAIEAMTATMRTVGNASSLHTAGRLARALVEESRERIGVALDARPSEVIFTSGGTESDNLAIKGTYAARRATDPSKRTIVASAIEHHAVLDPIEFLVNTQGARVRWLGVDRGGRLLVDSLDELLAERADSVALISVMWANNEVGTVQPVREVVTRAQAYGIPVHTDAVQAVGHLPVSFADSGVDLMTITGHKVGGPLGIGLLLARRSAGLVPLVHGGGQERQVRSGTLDVPGIVGLAAALDVTVAQREAQTRRLTALRDRLIEGALGLGLGAQVTGTWRAGDAQERLAGHAHLIIEGCEGDSLLYLLDAAGIECSTGSACQAGVPQPSHVVLALGHTEAQARGALRLTLGHSSTDADVEAFLGALPAVVERARRAAGVA